MHVIHQCTVHVTVYNVGCIIMYLRIIPYSRKFLWEKICKWFQSKILQFFFVNCWKLNDHTYNAQFLWRKNLQEASNLQNSRKFSPTKISCYTVLYTGVCVHVYATARASCCSPWWRQWPALSHSGWRPGRPGQCRAPESPPPLSEGGSTLRGWREGGSVKRWEA